MNSVSIDVEQFKKKPISKRVNEAVFSLVSASLLSLSVGVDAEEYSGFMISPMIGYMHFDSEHPFKGLPFDDKEVGSLGLGYRFPGAWGVELRYLMGEPDFEVGANAEVDLEQITLDLLYHFNLEGRFTPYLIVGGGETQLESEIAFDGNRDTTILNYGGGFKLAFSNSFALRTEIRDIYSWDNETNDVLFNLGFQLLFGGKAPQSRAAPQPVKPLDSDNDGIPNNRDKCPSTASGVETDAMGCEVKRDDDGDGVVNRFDQCSGTKPGAKVDDKGCYVIITEDVNVQLNINFANNSNEMVSGQDQISDVARFMKEHPLTKVVVEGHTDSRGSATYNQSLSEKRAKAVADTLINRFDLDAARVSYVGYGEEKPIASNETAAGRSQNRRVSAVVSATVEKIAE